MSETVILGIKYLVTWVSRPGACVRCLALNGKEWTVDNLEVVPFFNTMFSHPNCRCEVDVEIEVDPMELQVW